MRISWEASANCDRSSSNSRRRHSCRDGSNESDYTNSFATRLNDAMVDFLHDKGFRRARETVVYGEQMRMATGMFRATNQLFD